MSLILDNIIFSLQRAGGISVVWQQLLSHMACDASAPDYICLEYSGCKDNIFYNYCGVPQNRIVGSKKSIRIARYISPHIQEEPYVFHSSYYRIAGDKHVRNISTVHDFTYEYFKSGLAKQVHLFQKYKAIRNSATIVCISQNTKQDLLKFLPDMERHDIRVIYNGVSDEYAPINVPDNALRDFVLFVGARPGYKNFDFLVKSLKESSYKLIICGRPLSQEEISLLNKNLGEDRYITCENFSNADLNQLYNSVHCLVYPSSYEGFGIPVVEAQKAGCPVIALNASSIPEVIGYKSTLMESLSSTELIDKINMLRSSSFRQEVIEAGLENAKRFSWERMYQQYKEIYEEQLIRL